jgi:hypothetical protein
VLDSRGKPDYPPARNAWQFPPPPISSRWKWAAIAVGLVGLIGGGTTLGILIALGANGLPGAIDNPHLLSVIERECDRMTSRVESIEIAGPPERQALAIADQNHAVDVMVAAIRDEGTETLEDDPPTVEWLADWDRLVAARTTFAKGILEGEVVALDIPDDDRGRDIYLRMDDVFFGDSSCEVPEILLNPYPGNASSI